MRSVLSNVLGLGVLLSGMTLAVGQEPPPASPYRETRVVESDYPFPFRVSFRQPPPPTKPADEEKKTEPKKSALEEMLEQALRHNPDIHVAEVKLREAEAELNRTRLLVAQKVVALHANRDLARSKVVAAEERFQRLKEIRKSGNVALEELEAAAAALQQAKADLAKIESEIPYLTGKPPVDAAVSRGMLWLQKHQEVAAQEELARANELLARTRYFQSIMLAHRALEENARGPEADKLRAALDKPVNFVVEGKAYAETLGALAKVAPDVTFQVKGGSVDNIPRGGLIVANLKNVPLGAVLEFVEDGLPQHSFYVRDYGLLLIAHNQQVPPGAVPLREFWKGSKTESKDKPEKK